MIWYIRDANGELLARKTATTVHYHLVDGLGSITKLIDDTGTTTNEYSYAPWGVMTVVSAGVYNPWRYAAGFHDTDTGLPSSAPATTTPASAGGPSPIHRASSSTDHRRVPGGARPGRRLAPTTRTSPYPPLATGGSCNEFTPLAAGNSPNSSPRCPAVTSPWSATRIPKCSRCSTPAPLLDSAASIAARYRAGGLLVAETIAAGLVHGRQLWFGLEPNVGRSLAAIAGELDIAVHVTD